MVGSAWRRADVQEAEVTGELRPTRRDPRDLKDFHECCGTYNPTAERLIATICPDRLIEEASCK